MMRTNWITFSVFSRWYEVKVDKKGERVLNIFVQHLAVWRGVFLSLDRRKKRVCGLLWSNNNVRILNKNSANPHPILMLAVLQESLLSIPFIRFLLTEMDELGNGGLVRCANYLVLWLRWKCLFVSFLPAQLLSAYYCEEVVELVKAMFPHAP